MLMMVIKMGDYGPQGTCMPHGLVPGPQIYTLFTSDTNDMYLWSSSDSIHLCDWETRLNET